MFATLGTVLAVGLIALGGGASGSGGPSSAFWGGVGANGPRESASEEVKEAYPVVIRDWRRAMRGASLRLGAISDGVYNIYAHKDRIVLEMPPLRARWLARTRAVIDRRYGDAPVTVRLSRLTRPKLLGRPAVVPVRGEPLHCPGGRLGPGSQRWNVKQIVGMHIRVADRIARHHGCTVKALIIDGMGQGGTSDFSHDRINVVMRGKRVVRILGLA